MHLRKNRNYLDSLFLVDVTRTFRVTSQKRNLETLIYPHFHLGNWVQEQERVLKQMYYFKRQSQILASHEDDIWQ